MKYIIVLLGTLLPLLSNAQSTLLKELSIGDVVANIYIDSIYNPITQTIESAQLSDLNDRLIIFDFWATWCGPCIRAMPKLDSLQKLYEKEIKVIPVTRENEKIVAGFFSARKNLSLKSVVNDTKLNSVFPNRSIPHAVILDKNHKVVAITNSDLITSNVIDSVLKGNSIQLPEKLDLIGYKKDMPYIINGNAQLKTENIIFHSLLSKRIAGIGSSFIKIYNGGDEIGFHYSNMTLPHLFLASLRKPFLRYVHNRIYFENVEDSSRYIILNTADEVKTAKWALDNTFSYEIVAPLLDDSARHNTMFNDLNKAIGAYYNMQASWEEKTIPCLVLRKISNLPDPSKSSFNSNRKDNDPLFENVSLEAFVRIVETFCKIPLIMEIDPEEFNHLYLPHNIREVTNPTKAKDEINKVLHQSGLELYSAKKPTEVLVIKEK